MSHTTFRWALAVAIFLGAIATSAQPQVSGGATVPRLIRFGGVLKDSARKPLQGTVGITFALYKDQDGGAALWLETQNVALDAGGHYSVLLGATKDEGIPTELFISGQAQWLGVHVQDQPEQPRVWMVSVPYALKAADAETLGGLPPSAFAPAAKATSINSAANPAPTAAVAAIEVPIAAAPTGSGTTNFLPLWTSPSNLSSSVASQVGGNLGIGFSSPLPGSFASRLDVNGGANIRGLLQLLPTGSATASAGRNSNAFDLVGSSFFSTLSQPANQRFRWQVEPVGNNTSSASGKLSLLYGPGSSTPTETGFSISSRGVFTFASGQGFPGTITSVGLSAPASDFKVSGSPITKSGTLALNWKTAPTNLATANAIVKRDSAGSFHGAQIVGDLGVAGFTALTCSSCAGVSGVNTGGGLGMYAQGGGGLFATASSGVGIWGQSSGTSGGSDGVHGVTSSATASGVAGVNTSGGIGVYGAGGTTRVGAGVYGTGGNGVWGDAGAISGGVGVYGTAQDGVAGLFNNNSGLYPLEAINDDAAGPLFLAWNHSTGSMCTIDSGTNLTCNGSKSAVVRVDNDQRWVALYAEESPENWFADYGSGQLRNGVATVRLETTYAQTVNTELEYHVFLTPNGDCNGLYVIHKTATSFEVHELKGGRSNIAFDYRIVAKRKGYEAVRLADKTAMMKASSPSIAGFRKGSLDPK